MLLFLLSAGKLVASPSGMSRALSPSERHPRDPRDLDAHHGRMTRLLTTPLIPTSELRRRGMGRAAVEREVHEGRLWQVHRGWYAQPGTDAQLIRAMRLGGRLGCVSALRLYGAWTPPDSGLHLLMPRSASGRRLTRAADSDEIVRVYWHAPLGEQKWTDGIAPIAIAAAQAVRCQPRDMAVAVLDSLVHRRLLSSGGLRSLLDGLPWTARPTVESVDGRSEEGIESLARVRLGDAGIDAVPQHIVEGIGLVDGWLVLELDGRETHAQQEAFGRDRRRTALLQQRGFTVLHFSYAQVVYDWDLVLDTVRAALAQR